MTASASPLAVLLPAEDFALNFGAIAANDGVIEYRMKL